MSDFCFIPIPYLTSYAELEIWCIFLAKSVFMVAALHRKIYLSPQIVKSSSNLLVSVVDPEVVSGGSLEPLPVPSF